MKRLIVVLALLVTGVLSPAAEAQDYNRLQRSVLRILGYKHLGGEEEDQQHLLTSDPNYSCTGFVVFVHRVLTAAHCKGEDMTADGIPAQILSVDEEDDLMLLAVETDKPSLKLRKNAPNHEDILTAIGFAYGFPSPAIIPQIVRLVGIAPPWDPEITPGVITQPGYIGGMSGGPVVDESYRVVCIVQQGDSSEEIGYGVGANVIRKFLGVK